MRHRLIPTSCAVLMLAACSGENGKASGGTAEGEILPASVSDEMLPYDSVRSQAPLAPKPGGSDAAKDDRDEPASERREADAPAMAAEPEPAEPEAAEAE